MRETATAAAKEEELARDHFKQDNQLSRQKTQSRVGLHLSIKRAEPNTSKTLATKTTNAKRSGPAAKDRNTTAQETRKTKIAEAANDQGTLPELKKTKAAKHRCNRKLDPEDFK